VGATIAAPLIIAGKMWGMTTVVGTLAATPSRIVGVARK